MVCGVVCSWAGPVPRGKQQLDSRCNRNGILDPLIARFLVGRVIGDVESLSVTPKMQARMGAGQPLRWRDAASASYGLTDDGPQLG